MGYTKAPRAFNDAREILNRALDSPKGLRIPCASRSAAIILRARLNYLRKQDRQDNRVTYEEGHPLHNSSVFDIFVLRIPPKGSQGENVLYIEPRSIDHLTIEEIQ